MAELTWKAASSYLLILLANQAKKHMLERLFACALAKLGQRTDGNQLSLVDDGHPFTKRFYLAHYVGAEDYRPPFDAAAANEPRYSSGSNYIQSVRRFIKEEHRRFV